MTGRTKMRRLAVVLLAVVVAAAGYGWWRARPRGPVPPPIPTEGVSAAATAKLTAAREAVAANRASGEAWGHLGHVLTAHGFDATAAECYAEARRLDPGDDRWPYMLALYHLSQTHDAAAAITQLEIALAARHRTAAREAAVRLRLAETDLAERRLADAERLFREHLSRDPTDARAKLGLGVTLLAADRPADAVAPLTAAADSPLTRKQATTNLAVAARLLGDPATAARHEQQAAQLPDDPPPPDPFAADAAALKADGRGGYDEVMALERAGRLADTIPILTRLAQDPADVRAAVTLGTNLSLLGRPADAEPYLRSACARDPNHVQAALSLGTVLFDLAARETANPERRTTLLREAAESCGRATALKPDHGMAHFCRARALDALGDRPAALPHYRLAADCRPEVPQVQLGLLAALADAGEWTEAKARLAAAERVVPAADLAAVRGRINGK